VNRIYIITYINLKLFISLTYYLTNLLVHLMLTSVVTIRYTYISTKYRVNADYNVYYNIGTN